MHTDGSPNRCLVYRLPPGCSPVPVAWALITLSTRHGATDPLMQWDHAPHGDGTLPFPGLRSVGLTSVSAIGWACCLDLGNGAGSSAASDDCPLGAGSAAGSAAASPARVASMAWMAFATALPEGSVHFSDAHPPRRAARDCTQALR